MNIWPKYQKYCTACAVLAMISVILLTFLLSKDGVDFLNVFTGNNCAQDHQNDTGQGEETRPSPISSGDTSEAADDRDDRHDLPKRADKNVKNNDEYGCRLAAHTRNLAIFTGLLFIATVGLIVVGVWHGRHLSDSVDAAEKLAASSQRNVDLIPEIERAYLSGGGVSSITIPFMPAFGLHIENNGKTPGYLNEYALVLCDLFDVQNGPPEYLNPVYQWTTFVDRISPNAPGKTIAVRQFARIVRDPIAYGRFRYNDIWGHPYYFSFILPLWSGDDHSIVAGLDPEYTRWT